MPDRRATFLSVVSPHDPRTCGLRRALTRVAASRRIASPASRTVRTWDRISVAIWTRSFSTSVSRAWNSLRLAATGASICSVACIRCWAEVSTDLRCCSATSWDSSRNCSTIVCRPASISSERATAASRWASATATSASALRGRDAGVGELLVHLRPARAGRRPSTGVAPRAHPTPRPSARATRESSAVVMQASSPRPPTEPGTTRPRAAFIAYPARYGPPRRRPCHDRDRGRWRRPSAGCCSGARRW